MRERTQQDAHGLRPVAVSREFATAALLGAVVFAVLALYWAARIRVAYSPAGDEFSLLAHSAQPFHPQPLEWFRRGFSGYFSPFPDLSLPYSNFIRPAANMTYFLQSVVFGRRWSMYLLGSYAIEATLVAAVWFIARVCLDLRRSLALPVTAACAVSPAFNYLVVSGRRSRSIFLPACLPC